MRGLFFWYNEYQITNQLITLSNPYKRLGVEPNATPEEIKKAYRKLANKHHPDKGGLAEDFAPIQAAYDILKNERTRSLYDETGITEDKEEKLVTDRLTELFGQIVQESQMGTTSVMTRALSAIEASNAQNNQMLEMLSSQKASLKTRYGKFKRKSEGRDLYKSIIDAKIAEIDDQVRSIKYHLHLNKGMMEELEQYEDGNTPTGIRFRGAA